MEAHRRGFTLVELLVVISVIGLLVALALAAVHAARGAALRVQCSNNMRQIGLGIQHHAEALNAFPAGIEPARGYSFLMQILPYMEQRPLYNAINLSDDPLSNSNLTALRQTPGVFLCPADWRASEAAHAVNYAGNAGRSDVYGEGVFIRRSIAPREISDGLSLTAGVAEWVVGGALAPPEPSRFDTLRVRYRLLQVFSDQPQDLDAFIQACEALNPADVDFGVMSTPKGHFWLGGSVGTTLYNHLMSVNRPSCTALQDMNAATASSLHGAAAHVLTMDGAVHFVKDSIDRRAWLAAGTRSGAEVVSDGPF